MLPSSSSNQQTGSTPDVELGEQRYEYRYSTGARAFAVIIVLLIPVATAGFIQLALRPGSLSDHLIPAVMAVVIIGAALFLAYRQAYFGWSVIRIYERGLRFDFWRKHLVIPWTNLGKFYLGPGRMPSWHIADANDHILCELRTSIVGHKPGAESASAPGGATPSIIDALVEEGSLVERDEPFKHYTPGPQGNRQRKNRNR